MARTAGSGTAATRRITHWETVAPSRTHGRQSAETGCPAAAPTVKEAQSPLPVQGPARQGPGRGPVPATGTAGERVPARKRVLTRTSARSRRVVGARLLPRRGHRGRCHVVRRRSAGWRGRRPGPGPPLAHQPDIRPDSHPNSRPDAHPNVLANVLAGVDARRRAHASSARRSYLSRSRMRTRSAGAAARRTGVPPSSSSATCQSVGTVSPSLPLARRTSRRVRRSTGIGLAA